MNNLDEFSHHDFRSLPLVVEGESKEVRYLGDGDVVIRLKPTVYSYTHNRTGVVEGTDRLRLRSIGALLPVLRDAGIKHTYKAVNDEFILSSLVLQPTTSAEPFPFRPSDMPETLFAVAPPIETVVKAVHCGTPKHRYYGTTDYKDRITGAPIENESKYLEPIVRFDWRNPMRDSDGNRLADEVMPDSMANWFVDTVKAKVAAEIAFLALRQHLSNKGVDLWDICFFIASDGETMFGEVSPDCMRVRAADGSSLDKDVWRSGGSEGDLVSKWQQFVGAQGTLGLMTEAQLSLVPEQKHTGLLVLFLCDIKGLGELIPEVLKHQPATFESFDDQTLFLSIKFLPSFWKMLGTKRFIKLIFNLIPDGLQMLRGIPKLVLMVEFNGDSEGEVRTKIANLHRTLKKHKARYEINGFEETPTAGKSEKFWVMRRNSFQILRSKVKDKHTAPFIDDLIVPPENLPEFLPRLRKIIKKYKLFATIAGHMGDGNFHIIPLMKIEDPRERAKLEPCMKEVNNLVIEYGGSVSGEHNDGMVRGPWLEAQYGREVVDIFREVKAIFDPQNIFNPHKKTDADWEYSFSHIREKF